MRWIFRPNFWWQQAFYLIVIGAIGAGIWLGRPYWQPLLGQGADTASSSDRNAAPVEKPRTLELGPQARENLNLVAGPVTIQDYWRTITIPGVVEDRPGITDRGITAPLGGVITQVHAFEGDIIQPGQKLFTIRLVSEYLQQTQSDLFRAIREVEIFDEEISRIKNLVDTGVLPGKRIIELEQQVSRQNARIDAYRQELNSRGLSQEQIAQVERGRFLTTFEVVAPPVGVNKQEAEQEAVRAASFTESSDDLDNEFFEVQALKVDLGQQVETGQALAVLANHESLFIKGYAFKKEASRLAKAAEESWTVEVEFTDDNSDDWPAISQQFEIQHLSNTTDPNSRTFDFFIPLENQSRVYEKNGRPFVVWRFRPGQRVNIRLPVEQIDDVIVLPAAAVALEGPEAFVFQQNGDLFNRIPVEVVHRDRYNVVIANDGSVTPGFYLAQNAAASLNRVLQAQAASGMQPGVHVHADGTVHAAH